MRLKWFWKNRIFGFALAAFILFVADYCTAQVTCSDSRCTRKVYLLDGTCVCTEWTSGSSNPAAGIYIDPFTGAPVVVLQESIPDLSIFNRELPFITNLKSVYSSGTNSFADPFLQANWEKIQKLRDGLISGKIQNVNENGTYRTELSKAFTNVDMYLADIIYSKITGSALLVQPKNYQLYYYHGSGNKIVEYCRNIHKYFWEGDLLLNEMPPYLLRLELLSMLDKYAYSETTIKRRSAISVLYKFLTTDMAGKTVADYKEHNNLCMRAMAAMAMEDFTIPKPYRSDASNYLKTWIKEKYSPNGGYGEGSDYLGYLNEILLPYFYVGISCGWISGSEETAKIIENSGLWLLDIIDPSGYLPEIDDASGGKAYMIAPYMEITQRYSKQIRDMAIKNRGYRNNAVIDFLTYKGGKLHSMQEKRPSYINVSNGIGKINVIRSSDTISFALITEKGSETPDLKKKGGSHDQVDHGSISLRRSTKDGVDLLILDPGYEGYGKKVEDGSAMRYINHNTLQFSGCTALKPYVTIQNEDMIQISTGVNLSANKSLHASYEGGISSPPKGLFGKYYSDCGGGTSDIIKQYENGFDCNIEYDIMCGYNRAVIEYSGCFYVFDRVYPKERLRYWDEWGFLLRFNMPPASTTPGSMVKAKNVIESESVLWDKYYYDRNYVPGKSKIRISAFSDKTLMPVTTGRMFFYSRDFDPAVFGKCMAINVANYCEQINTVPSVPNLTNKRGFISILEPVDISTDFEGQFSQSKYETAIIAFRTLKNGNIIYAFENVFNSTSTKATDIPENADKHHNFKTDAEFGIIEFDPQRERIVSANLFNVKNAEYHGASINIPISSVGHNQVKITSDNRLYVLSIKANTSAPIDQTDTRFEKLGGTTCAPQWYLKIGNRTKKEKHRKNELP